MVSAALTARTRARSVGGAVGTWLDGVPAWRVVLVFLAAQWALVTGIALTVRHNRWI